jgi:hypothetical protein
LIDRCWSGFPQQVDDFFEGCGGRVDVPGIEVARAHAEGEVVEQPLGSTQEHRQCGGFGAHGPTPAIRRASWLQSGHVSQSQASSLSSAESSRQHSVITWVPLGYEQPQGLSSKLACRCPAAGTQ